MPFQPVNFAFIAPQGNPMFRNLISDLTQGFKAAKLPGQMNRQKEQEELSNSFKKLQLDEEPQRFSAQMNGQSLLNALRKQQMDMAGPMNEAKLGLLQAQMQKALRPPQQPLSDIEQSIAGMKRIEEQFGKGSPEASLAMQLFNKKAYSAGTQSADMPTKAFITQNQKTIQSIDNTLPMIDQLIKFKGPGQFVGKYIHPDDQAKYEALTATITDSLVNSLGLPKTNESIALVSKIVGKNARESDQSYLKRLESLKNELGERRKKSINSLDSGIEREPADGKTRVFYNGKAHLIPNDRVEEALASGGSLNG